MSRIGQKPILIPAGVKVAVEGSRVTVKGPKGELARLLPDKIMAQVEGDKLLVKNDGPTRQHKAWHGLSRSLLNGMVEGTTKGFYKKLGIVGVGYKAELQGKTVKLALGFSHPVLFPVPDGIKVTITDNVNILIEGIDKQKVGAVAAGIRGLKPPEPYKKKGIRYLDMGNGEAEHLRTKEGKTAASK
jgi:large subunit ribosomal protein L6